MVNRLITEHPIELRPNLVPLFENHRYLHAISKAILKEGLGEAYSNDFEKPTLALLLHRFLAFLAGDENDILVQELLKRIPPKKIIFVPDKKWDAIIKDFWGDKLRPRSRTKFSSDELQIEHMKEILSKIPQEMEIKKLDENTIEQTSKLAKGIIRILFPSLDDFIKTNFGFYLKHNDTIVSVALAATPIYNNEFEIHIETDPEYQRRGLAMIVCAKLIQYSLEKNLIPHWDADNEPSTKLALKLGFTKPERYDAYYWLEE